MNKNIFIVDDHTMMREGISSWIEKNTEWKVTGSFNSIAITLDCLSACKNNNTLPSIIIIDIDLGNENGFSLLEEVRLQYPEINAIMYSMHHEQGYAVQAKKLGAKGYISKAADSLEFKKCLEHVGAGKDFLEESMQQKNDILANYMEFLTKKEQIVLQELLKGKPNESIAETLNITLHSAEVYVSKIYDKLGIPSRSELIKRFG